MQIQESKKYYRRPARPSKIHIKKSENDFFNEFFSKCRNEPIKYGKVILLYKAGNLCHIYFEDSVPVEIHEDNEPMGETIVSNEQ